MCADSRRTKSYKGEKRQKYDGDDESIHGVAPLYARKGNGGDDSHSG